MKRKFALVGAAAALTLGTSAGSVSAAPGPTGDQGCIGPGCIGAWNMTNEHAQYGMFVHAMATDNPNGNRGMCNAVLVTSGVGC